MSRSPSNLFRRKILVAGGVASVAPRLTLADKLLPTPQQTAGPFYPDQLPLDDDNDLTRVAGRNGAAKGQTTDLSGSIVDTNGHALKNIRVEIWQCDANGRYHHPGDGRPVPIDENFQGHGHTFTDSDGRYRFRTIRPVHYPGRTPHIHAAVFPSGERPLVTQIYIKDEPRNARDFLFARIPAELRPLVVADFETMDGDAEFSARFNMVLGVTPRQA